jgi:hypothetical protein
MKNMIVRWAAVGCAVLLAGCIRPRATGPVPGTDEQGEITLTLGETRLLDEDVSVTFGRVGEDSRCPADVQCITAGNAVVALLIQERGEHSETLQLNTHSNPRSKTEEEMRFEVISLTPLPKAGEGPPSTYVVRLRITRA